MRFSQRLFALCFLLLLSALAPAACRPDRIGAPTATPTRTLPAPDTAASAERTSEINVDLTATVTPTLTAPTPAAVDITPLLPTTDLPADVSPFTGLKAADSALLKRMPAAVKISNSPIARPQSGLSRADVVVEHLAEGDITRFTAIFHSQDAERIGSIRSARLIDLELPVLFDAYLVYSGANGEVNRLIEASDFARYTVSDERRDPAFYRLDIPGRAYEHTLFTDSELLAQYAEDNGWTETPRARGWQWSAAPGAQAQPATHIEIPYGSQFSDVTYDYDTTQQSYARSILGEPHVDDITGGQLHAANVVVLYVPHVETLIVEDALGSKSLQIQLWGQGRMQLFRDGTVQEGVWLRPQRGDPLLFAAPDLKNPLTLKPGNVWLQIVPLDMAVVSQ